MSERFGSLVDVARATFVHDTARLYGKMRVDEGVTIWPYVVARAENQEIVVGAYTNLQDFVMLHVGDATPTIVGAHCSITHRVTLHGCTVGDNCLIGIGATLMDGCVIGENSIVAGHAIVGEGVVVPPNSIVAGVPAKVIASRDNSVANRLNAWMYYRNGLAYRAGEHRAWSDPATLAARADEAVRLRAERSAS